MQQHQQEEANTTASSTKVTTKKNDPVVVDVEDLLHQAALQQGQTTYQDPVSGFTVFTELSHLKRGTCCGNKCRHCPYGYENVKPQNMTPAMKLKQQDAKNKIQSGDRATASAMVERILANATSISGGSAGTKAPSKNVPYTRTGDRGTSQLGTGERRSKDDCNFEALGTVDELCSVAGVVHAHLESSMSAAAAAATTTTTDDKKQQKLNYGDLNVWMLDIMSRLFDIGSHVAKPRDPGTVDFTANGIGDGFDTQHIKDLEGWINEMTEALPELTSFILPTGAPAAAHLHVARTVCRRAERRMIPLVIEDQTCDPNAMKYLNRLSDFFFVAARWVNYCEGQPEIQYQRDAPQTTQRQRVARSLQHEE
jgi:cob(I)alamin adenosyltransferase